jgi:hypothetical protein
MYIALISHSPCKYCKYLKFHGAWEAHLIFDDRPPCLNKVHYHYHHHNSVSLPYVAIASRYQAALQIYINHKMIKFIHEHLYEKS